ncbi:MAG: extracellular solute-binding protein [Chloroflexia bacterium]|nr:extracellular solute-binding protein [Chloroflexia bacterium]
MADITRRRLVGQAAVAGAAAMGGTMAAKAAPAPGQPDGRGAAQDRTEITIYHIWGTPPGGTPAETPHPMTQVIDAFNAQSTTVMVNSQTPGNYQETLQKTQADIAAGNPPDLVSVPWANLHYAIDGLGVRELPAIAGDQFEALRASMSEPAWPLVTRDETVYGFPWGLSTPILYYNADVFEAAAVDPAEAFATWESFAAACPALQEQLGGNPVFALSFNKDWPAQTIIQSNGGRVLNEDGTFGFASEEAKAAMQTIADLDAAGFYDRGTTEELRPNFVAASTAVFQASVASLGGLNNDTAFTLGTSTWPQFGDKPVSASTGGSFLGSFTEDEAKHPALLEFLTFCASEEGYTLWNQTGYVNISNIELERLPGQEPAYAQFDAGLELETNWPSSRGLEAQNTWDVYCQRMWANDISVEEGTSAALEEIQAITGQG